MVLSSRVVIVVVAVMLCTLEGESDRVQWPVPNDTSDAGIVCRLKENRRQRRRRLDGNGNGNGNGGPERKEKEGRRGGAKERGWWMGMGMGMGDWERSEDGVNKRGEANRVVKNDCAM